MTSRSNEQIVREFFGAMGPTLEDFKRNYAARMSEDVVWESVGLPAHHGKDACIAYLDDLHLRTGMDYCTIEVLHMASAQDVVLSERLDTMFRADGTPIMTFRLMGTIQLRDGLITRYTDYLDTLSVASMAGSGRTQR